MTVLISLTRDEEVKSKQQFIDDLIKQGYIVIKRDYILGRFYDLSFVATGMWLG